MRRFLFLFFIIISGFTWAKDITVEQAKQMADSFWQSSHASRSSKPSLVLAFNSERLATRSSSISPAYYVFNNSNGPGFVIVAGDDIAMPILGYSFENEASATNLPVNMKMWLNHIREDVNKARNNNIKAVEAVTNAWKSFSTGSTVVRMETAMWDQWLPYNQFCPTINSNGTYTGCVITALAIVMRYHQWPQAGKGTLPGYVTNKYTITVPGITLGHTYNWTNMPLQYTNYSYSSGEEVAVLMRDLGIMLKADYGPYGTEGTSAYTSDIPSAIIKHMDYDKTARFISRDYYTTTEWNSLMKQELNSNRPVIYSGANDLGGHAFVLDGYTDKNYYSVNWGWSGYYNGYFLLTALDPEGQGAGGSGAYNNYQAAIIGIQKNIGSEGIEELQFVPCEIESKYVYGFAIDNDVTSGTTFMLYTGGIMNSGSDIFYGDIKFAVTDKQGNIIDDLYIWEDRNLQPNYYNWFTNYLTFNHPILPGYRIRGYYKSEKTPEWTLIKGNEEECCKWELPIADEYSIEETTLMTFNKENHILTLQTKDGVTVSLKDENGNDYSSYCSRRENQITVNTSELQGGRYNLTLQKGDDIKSICITLPDVI